MILELLKRVKAFEREAHNILAVHETSSSRVILLEDTYKQLKALSMSQDDLFQQSLKCIKNELFRAAHVMAWASFMDFLEEKISSDGFKKINAVRPKWNIKTVEDLRENVPEYQLIIATKDLKLCSRNEMKALIGLLNKRNECAHPSNYFPKLNDSLGYLSELLQRIGNLQPKVL